MTDNKQYHRSKTSKSAKFKMMTMVVQVLMAITTLTYAPISMAEQSYHYCDKEWKEFSSKPDSRYQLMSDPSEIRDVITGLIWQRCTIGQTWNNSQKKCTGNATKLSWQQALKQTEALGNGYRLPNIKELNSLVELRCAPSLNKTAFAFSKAGNYWSATPSPKIDTINNNTATAFLISFYQGNSYSGNLKLAAINDSPNHYARAVRTAP